jgi:hypothetical protein
MSRRYRGMKMFKKAAAFITALMIVFAPVLNVSAFSDTENNWAKEYIDKLSGMGAIYGKEDGLFHPGDTILRSEFTAILLRSLGNDVGQPDSGKWYTLYMQEAEDKGYVKAGEFQNVEQNITRLEIARMITRVLGKEQLAAELHGKHTGFKDDYTVAMADKGYVIILKEYGVVNGTPEGYFLPDRSADRAEAAKMIVTFLENRDIDLSIEPNNYAKGEDDTLIVEGREVVTSHSEMIPHIRKAMEIMSQWGYTTYSNNVEGNQVVFKLYATKEDSEGMPWDVKPIILWCIFETERSEYLPADRIFYPYSIILEMPENEMGREMFLDIVEDLCPEVRDDLKEIINKKLQNDNYEKIVSKKINGKYVDYGVQKQYKQIGFNMSL